MFRLQDIPVEVLLDNVLPSLPIRGLLRLGSTNRFFATLCNDDTLWKRKLQQDFHFSGESTARSTGWKFIYQGLSHPRTYVWGESTNGRLGRPDGARDAPFPIELRLDCGARIVHIAAAGMCFFALDSNGALYAWGTLNGLQHALHRGGFSAPGRTAYSPMKLNLPITMHAISCGRLHATGLDDKSNVWNFLSFGRPFRLVTPLLDGGSPDSTPVQIASGWSFSSVLTKGGCVFVWWPLDGDMKQRVDARNIIMDEQGLFAHPTEHEIPCAHWELFYDPYRLPELPRLPKLDDTGAEDMGVYLVKIAALHSHLIGLTNYGHVVKILVQTRDTARLEGWTYLPQFSESEKIQHHVISAAPDLSFSLKEIRITHVSAQFETFVAYSTGSTSIVLLGSHETDSTTAPRILPALQNRNVISVVLGDYHFGALTSTGKLLTWGLYSRGALGLGRPADIPLGQPGGYRTEQQRQQSLQFGRNPPAVTEPAEVRFDHEERRSRKRFCFAATSAGWHMGALVIDLEPHDSDDEDDTNAMPGGFPGGPGSSAPADSRNISRPSIFRVGFAGRRGAGGRFRGHGGP